MLNTSVGTSIDKNSRDDSRIETKSDGACKEVRFGLTKAIANSGVTASVDYGMGGKDHFDTDFDHQWFGL
ncbi:hypothetical protein [Acinetobacter sp. G11]|uniref:hypothetical protein n=1 Tax=Acinetobacter sp. G11 TaxID=3415989 RepID=UPI003C7D806D